jgi:hypothetical protein
VATLVYFGGTIGGKLSNGARKATATVEARADAQRTVLSQHAVAAIQQSVP